MFCTTAQGLVLQLIFCEIPLGIKQDPITYITHFKTENKLINHWE